MKKNAPDGQVPMAIINQLNEHTAGGFILFYFNSETGSPEQMMVFDSPAHCLGLQKHINDWLQALQDLNIESERANIINALQVEEPPEETV